MSSTSTKRTAWNSTLRPGKPLRRRTPLKKVNRKRKKKRQENGEVYGPYHRWVSRWPCMLEGRGCRGPVAGHHIKTVGAGGKDVDNEVPLCLQHHDEVHWSPVDFESKYDVNLGDEAIRYGDRFRVGLEP